MSSIYYKEKKNINEDPFLFKSDIITYENVVKVLKSTSCGLGLNNPIIPFPSTSWRNAELYYDHADLGKIYIPKNIHFTDGKNDFFIVLIDTKIDIVFWDMRNPASRNSNGQAIFPVTVTQEEFEKVAISFYALIDHLGVNKPIEEQYKNVKGSKLKRESIAALIKMFSPHSDQVNLIEKVFSAAVKPVAFYKDNRQYLEQLEIEEPSKEMYILILIYQLEDSNTVCTLDWKSSAEDINHAISKLSNGEITTVLDAETTNQSMPKMLKTATAKLQKKGLFLLKIYTDTDSYSILLAEENKVQGLIDLAKECKIKITAC